MAVTPTILTSSRFLILRYTLVRFGDNRETEYYKPHMEVREGVWVIDRYDNDREKFFYLHRLLSVQRETSIDDLI